MDADPPKQCSNQDQPSTNSLNALNVTLLAMRKLQGGLNPAIFFAKTLLNTYISSFPFATSKVVKL